MLVSLALAAMLAAWPTGATIAARALSLVGKHELRGGGKAFEFDSVGLVRAVFADDGIDVFRAPAIVDPQRTGVEILYQYAAIHGRLHTRRVPGPGDLVFFGKTRDANRDGVPDTISHVGIVVDVKPNGTATVVTATMSRVLALPMNRLRPGDAQNESGELINASLLTPASPDAPQLLSRLFYTFATL
jgi:hypothetical protein